MACKGFKASSAAQPTEETTRSFLGVVFQKATPARTTYMSVSSIPPTSNECERFFSQAKLVYTEMRKSMDVNTLGVLVFLSYNRDAWDVGSVQAIRRKMHN
ncbi:hypothetical protein F441_03857 [Phytophthora nicotianae CJ01A1]|uniref:HAT C-terminal dimerisation domain-containing protein n=3 Tax=Phytophthora nicotianae TaxID=4792 RepID=W2QP45_PHYN3|nr:hypothetical protein PPTG_08685 [Phytophthora nicotianae INRA-310]ETN14030.1 hypothetical protein PPTG_08685 [Phytophthora nicotianae INRA-310]ETO81808.1 hypothetical protein F444_03948 [Phytophthora nicotianae P1976]ETP22936.1 hypothetical protein F441_03857 [Phytophthora nicotianae CJ01A1]